MASLREILSLQDFENAAVAREAGVRHAIAILRTEIDRDLALLGYAGIASVSRDLLVE